jgi:hypothetical protein
VDVLPQGRSRLAQAVAQPGPALVEPLDRLADGRRLDLETSRQACEERLQGGGKLQVGHGS